MTNKMLLDQYFTPRILTDDLLNSLPASYTPKVICDFSMGEGGLLESAFVRHPSSKIFGVDIDRKVVLKVKRKQPTWNVEMCDFLDESQREKSYVLNRNKGKVDLVLLNPPFSCRGSKKITIKKNGLYVNCSLAMAFILLSLDFLKNNGYICAILPDGAFQAERDEHAWGIINGVSSVDIGEKCSWNNFSNECHAEFRVAVIKYGKREGSRFFNFKNEKVPTNKRLVYYNRLVRGQLPVFRATPQFRGRGLEYIHTTNLRKGDKMGRIITSKASSFVGNCAVLLPRVGRSDRSKIIVRQNHYRCILSDCVIAIEVDSHYQASRIRNIIINNFSSFSKLYSGTGAPYITLKKLNMWLNNHNVYLRS